MICVNHRSRKLDNGLRVVTVELPHLHTATLVLYVRVGSRYETPTDNGLSHFLEHMFFRGTERLPSSLAMSFAIENLGGTLYAETGRDYSMYQVTLEPALIERGIELFGDIFGRPLFSQIELERQIILEEISEDFDDNGVELSLDDITRRLTFGEHPLAFRITGPRSNIERFTEADVRRHFAGFYGARNAIVCVAGPVSADDVERAAAAQLSFWQPGVEVTAEAPTFTQTAARFEFAHEAGTQTSFQLLLRADSELAPDYDALKALARILDDGMSTRLHYRLCDQLGLAYSVSAGIEPLHDVVLFEVHAETSNGKFVDLLGRTLELVAEFRDTPVTADELTKAKRRYHYDLHASLDDANAMASWFAGTALFYPPRSPEDKMRRVDAVTAEDITAVASRVFGPERLVVACVGGLNRGRVAEARQLVSDWC